MRLLHPFLPFVTEEIYQKVPPEEVEKERPKLKELERRKDKIEGYVSELN